MVFVECVKLVELVTDSDDVVEEVETDEALALAAAEAVEAFVEVLLLMMECCVLEKEAAADAAGVL